MNKIKIITNPPVFQAKLPSKSNLKKVVLDLAEDSFEKTDINPEKLLDAVEEFNMHRQERLEKFKKPFKDATEIGGDSMKKLIEKAKEIFN